MSFSPRLSLSMVILVIGMILSCSNNSDMNPVGPGPNSMTVTIRDNFFDPATITVPVGSTVGWQHMGSAQHTVTSGAPNAPSGLFDSSFLNPGQMFQFTFTQKGTIQYFCRIHGAAMTGTVVVQ